MLRLIIHNSHLKLDENTSTKERNNKSRPQRERSPWPKSVIVMFNPRKGRHFAVVSNYSSGKLFILLAEFRNVDRI